MTGFRFPADADWFGLRPETDGEIVAAWGARAILVRSRKAQYVDLLHDRQQAMPYPPAEFVAWLDGPMMAWLKGGCGQSVIDPGSYETFRLDDGVFHAIASPRRSFGYFYVGAWMEMQS
jgi:hypothetical protein